MNPQGPFGSRVFQSGADRPARPRGGRTARDGDGARPVTRRGLQRQQVAGGERERLEPVRTHHAAVLDADATPAREVHPRFDGDGHVVGHNTGRRGCEPRRLVHLQPHSVAEPVPEMLAVTSRDDDVTLMIGVDTCVFTGFVDCGAVGAITGIGCVLPKEVIHMCNLAKAAAKGDPDARARALELESALAVLSSFDEGPDLVLFFKHMMVLKGDKEYTLHFNETDALTDSQRGYVETQLKLFDTWYEQWSKLPGAVQSCKP